MDEKCFAEVAYRRKCAVLTVEECPGCDICAFFKTDEQVKVEQQKAFERIASLPFETQKYISNKHYNNKMPWHVKR